ncbi:MAG: MarR family transcriptional regulator [Firmicutes bacterium]|jgi:DNA-binding MarR family transcriptional regulator|nr:MarR family transcriptional regulator [Bacillota bacterium]
MNEHRDLLNKFFWLQRLLGRFFQHKRMQHGPMGNIHRGQGRILALLKIKPEISQKELSNILDMRPQSLGELLEKLERNGYITREPSTKDHRIMNVKLTEAGKELSNQKIEQSFTEDLFSRLNEEERSQLSVYLDRIIATLKEKFEEEGLEFHPPYHPKFKRSRSTKKKNGCIKQEE